MILKFPNLDTLHLCLVEGHVPAAMAQAPAVAGFDDDNAVWVETSAALPRTNQADLKKLNVVPQRSFPVEAREEVTCWAEILPLERDALPARYEQTPILFDVGGSEQLTSLMLEMLRLGNDRQGYRWLENPDEPDAARALIRVVGPPYYTLLRALDRIGGKKAPVAYVERAPRVWIEVGYTHPLVNHIKVPAGKILAIRPPRIWTPLDDAAFREVYTISEFLLPDAKVAWTDTAFGGRIEVRPSLRTGGTPDGAELWVLRDDPVGELNRFVQNAPDDLLQRLAFAVGEKDGKTTIVVRVRQSKQTPPVLVFHNAVAYKHYLKLPNLFLPVGTTLHPPLRRDQVRKILAEDTNHVVWLNPGEKGHFTPETLPEGSFRPLWDWIDYVLDRDREALGAWMQASQFDFEAFVCDDEQKPKKGSGPGEGGKTRSPREKTTTTRETAATADFVAIPEEVAAPESAALEDFGTVKKVEPSVVQKQLRAVEEQFIAMEGNLDAPERQELWPQLANLNAQLSSHDEAGICWAHALWERDETKLSGWAQAWFLAEAGAVPVRAEGRGQARAWAARAAAAGAKTREIPADDLDRLLALDEPASADLRTLAAYLVYAATQPTPPEALGRNLGRVSRFLETHEKLLPIRAVWLAWVAMTRLSSGDVLALARSRDRLLERLYTNGLRPEQDLPGFLRFAGQPTSQRFRAVRQWMVELTGHAQEWAREGVAGSATAQTAVYVDLVFAFGLARLGESDASREILQRAKQNLSSANLPQKDLEAHLFLYNAFEFRVRQALDGKPHTGPLPADQLEYLEQVDRLAKYVVDRLRKHSHILEPDQRINPYRHWGARISDFDKALSELTDLTDRAELSARVDKLLKDLPKGQKGVEQRARVLRAGLEVAPRVGEEFARRMLEQSVSAYDALPETKEQTKELAPLMEQATFLEKALFVAGHFGRVEAIHPLVARFQKMLAAQRGPSALPVLDQLAAQCFRGLRKLGMRDEIDQILKQMADLVLEGHDVKSIDFKKREQGPAALRTLLQVASGWYFFGRDSQAEPILQAARTALLANDLQPRDQTALAVSYARAVGQAPVEIAQKRLEELFKQLKGIKDTYTTSSHFSVSQLDVVEAVVLAVVSDDFTMGTQARRWLDDDEFLVRRRIHKDVKAAMERH